MTACSLISFPSEEKDLSELLKLVETPHESAAPVSHDEATGPAGSPAAAPGSSGSAVSGAPPPGDIDAKKWPLGCPACSALQSLEADKLEKFRYER